jgi:hypothetical protein
MKATWAEAMHPINEVTTGLPGLLTAVIFRHASYKEKRECFDRFIKAEGG